MKFSRGFWDDTRTEYMYSFFFIALFIFPVWLFTYPASQDAYAHIYNTYLLQKLLSGDTFFSQYFVIKPYFIPNLINRIFLTPLFFIFCPLTSAKVLVSIYIAAFPLAFLYAARTFSKQVSRYAVLLILPLVYNSLYHKGFYNFIFALPFLFFFIGYWERNKNINSWGNWIRLFLLFVLAYFIHIMAIIVINIYICVNIAFSFYYLKGEREKIKRQIFNYISSSLLINIITLYYINKFSDGTVQNKSLYIYFHDTLAFFLYAFKSYSYWDLAPVAVGCIALAYLLVRIFLNRERPFSVKSIDVFAVAALVFILFYYLTGQPWYLQQRLAIVAIGLVLLWIALQLKTFSPRGILAASCIALLFWGYEIHTQAGYAPILRDYSAFSQYVHPHETILGFSSSEEGYTRVNPLIHFSSMFATENDLVDFQDYQSAGGFPVEYKIPHPRQLVENIERAAQIDPILLDKALRKFPVDHVVLHSPEEDGQRMRPFMGVLLRYYDQTARNGTGDLALYSRKKSGESLQGLSERLD